MFGAKSGMGEIAVEERKSQQESAVRTKEDDFDESFANLIISFDNAITSQQTPAKTQVGENPMSTIA